MYKRARNRAMAPCLYIKGKVVYTNVNTFNNKLA